MPLARSIVAGLRVRRASAAGASLALLALVCLPAIGIAPTAAADPPLRLYDQVTDNAGVLDDTQKDDIQTAIDDLHNTHKVQLWVVYVTDFDGQDPQAWARATAEKSGPFTARDIVMAVATVEREFALVPQPGLEGLTQSELEDIYDNSVRGDLRESDWSGAAIATAEGLSDALSSSGGDTGTVLLVGGAVVVAGAGGAALYARKRRKDKYGADIEAARTVDPTDTKALAALPIPALDARAKEILVELDNAIRTSSEELELARGEFGDAAARPFVTVFDNAKATLAKAFSIRQKLDDTFPETPDEQRRMLIDLISSCGRADNDLDAVVAEFDGMRNLLINAAERLDALTRDVIDLTTRIPGSGDTLTKLTGEFPAPTLEPIKANVSMAQERLAFADNNITAGRQAITLPAGKQGPAVGAIRAAESAVTQARTLLDAVDRAAGDIRNAIATLPAAIEDARNDIAAAGQLLDHGGQALRDAQNTAEAALRRAEALQDSNPLGAFNEIVAADVELDKLLAAATESKQDFERLAAQLEQALTCAQAQVAAAADFIGTRRGAVGAEPRTRLSEAQRHLDEAQRLRNSDVSNSLVHAQAAADLASRALNSAQSEVSQWESRSASSSSGSTAGAVLGGILIEGMLRGAMSGGRSRGGGHSRGPGSFGGSGSSGRIGVGGRF
ncbi:TPM domain-containing protein [Antrihabitans sp. YC2-6]|uniref:TPM domain-containing protein n=1 Tax=Antrihabitans sp. YC2-6 TaxID=2799498 RepID=UPI0018F4A859|nr:TPM domain-containing protein [Antrihabitans sp. YC2-6]MBJ8346881.1 TPM domain-containing protein [Antrihabitans sp. YC2-6]